MDRDSNPRKSELIRAALLHEAIAPCEVVMVGDRSEDIEAARPHGVKTIAVSYGFGSKEEIETGRPDYIVHTPGELVSCLETFTSSQEVAR